MSTDDRASRKPLPPRQTSLRTQIRDTLRRKIQHGEVGADERLVDLDIANSLGVSRMPVREALLELVSEGYLVGTTRGFMLPRLSVEDVADIFEIRKLLEPRAAANAARHLSAEAEEKLRAAFERAKRAHEIRDADELGLANMQYRHTWLQAEPNWRLAATISRFADQVQTVRLGTLYMPETQDIVIAGLSEITEAFLARDPAAAEARILRFIEAAENLYFAERARTEQAQGQTAAQATT
ncbi:GntR family transcriptional regulator [Amorphus sp. 3PC139-8]|uniref:GntR family transcriptional regulator n=1 Tax=Amorphus sp. 3PC139-8 TaxID=2735676 RepID=UPI00345DCB07